MGVVNLSSKKMFASCGRGFRISPWVRRVPETKERTLEQMEALWRARGKNFEQVSLGRWCLACTATKPRANFDVGWHSPETGVKTK